jgi:hypothetical protein
MPMAELELIPPNIYGLVRDCFTLDAIFVSTADLKLEPVSEYLPDETYDIICEKLGEGWYMFLYSLPRKEGEPKYALLVGKKDGEYYSLPAGFPPGNHDACTARLVEIAAVRKMPWSYRSRDTRVWVALVFATLFVGIASTVVTGMKLGMSAGALWLIFAELALCAGIVSYLLYLPKYFWESRLRRIEDALEAMAA